MRQLIAKSGEEGVFSPEEIRTLVAAFDAAWASVKSSGAPFSEDRYQAAGREILAKAIIQAAKEGERNEHRLREAALLELSKANPKKAAPWSKVMTPSPGILFVQRRGARFVTTTTTVSASPPQISTGKCGKPT